MTERSSATTTRRPDGSAWWRTAVSYQVYIRSFADGNGDGVGDLAGLRARLPYLRDLGVDAIWINPWYPSPMADGGYDVADFRAIEPTFGTLAEAEALITDAHANGLRVLLDIVPNHTSDQHAWFAAALAAGPGSPERARYHFRAGRGPEESLPPNDWRSAFGGPAWTRTVRADGTGGEWYLHLYAPEQPDLNWDNADVPAEFESVLRFWFDRGVDGLRIDVAHGLVKAPGLPDIGSDVSPGRPDHPHRDRDGVHDIFRGWRAVADSYDEPRVFVGEAWVPRAERLARYVRPDELHTVFNFEFLTAPWRPEALRRVIDDSVAALRDVGAPPTWVLSNHDVARHLSRYARPQPDAPVRHLAELDNEHVDLELGERRARAAVLLLLALPGGAYVYQGEELGLWEVEDLPDDVLADPTWERSEHTDRGRDGCLVPLPWSGGEPPFGFAPDGAEAPWLPQPREWADHTAEAQAGDPRSMLRLYRAALRLRREHAGEELSWLAAPDGVLLFEHGAGLLCAVNLSPGPVDLPAGHEIRLASEALEDERLPPDTAVWLRHKNDPAGD